MAVRILQEKGVSIKHEIFDILFRNANEYRGKEVRPLIRKLPVIRCSYDIASFVKGMP